jgi:hypothetical protein
MRPVTKKILEAGLIDKHVQAMLTRWGSLEGIIPPEQIPEMKRLDTKQKLERFVEELEELIDKEEETMRETPLDMAVGPMSGFVTGKVRFLGRWDPAGRLVSQPIPELKRGSKIEEYNNPKAHRVLDIVHLYQGNEVAFFLVTVEDW